MRVGTERGQQQLNHTEPKELGRDTKASANIPRPLFTYLIRLGVRHECDAEAIGQNEVAVVAVVADRLLNAAAL